MVRILIFFFVILHAPNDLVYGFLAVYSRWSWPLVAGAFSVALRQSELKISEANAGVPDSYWDAEMHSLPSIAG